MRSQSVITGLLLTTAACPVSYALADTSINSSSPLTIYGSDTKDQGGTVTVGQSGALELDGANIKNTTIDNNGTLSITGNGANIAALTWNSSAGSSLTGTATLDGALTLDKNSTYAGALTTNKNGSLTLDGASNMGASYQTHPWFGGINVTTEVTPGAALTDNGTVTVTKNNASVGSLSGTGNLILNGTLTLSDAGQLTSTSQPDIFAGAISGAGTLQVNVPSGMLSEGGSNLTLSGEISKWQNGAISNSGGNSLGVSMSSSMWKQFFNNNNGIYGGEGSGQVNIYGLGDTSVLITHDNQITADVDFYSSTAPLFVVSGDQSKGNITLSMASTNQNTLSLTGKIGHLDAPFSNGVNPSTLITTTGTSTTYIGGIETDPSSSNTEADGSLTLSGTLVNRGVLVRGAMPGTSDDNDAIRTRGKITVNGGLTFYSGAFAWNLSPKNTAEGRYDDAISVLTPPNAPSSTYYGLGGGGGQTFAITSDAAYAAGSSGQITVQQSSNPTTINRGLYRIINYDRFSGGATPGGLGPAGLFVPQVLSGSGKDEGTNGNSALQYSMLNVYNNGVTDGSQGGQIDLLAGTGVPTVIHNPDGSTQPGTVIQPVLFWNGSSSNTTWSADSSQKNWYGLDTGKLVVNTSTPLNYTAGQDVYFQDDPGEKGKTITVDGSNGGVKAGNIFFVNQLSNPTGDPADSAKQRYTLTGADLHLQNADTYISVGSTNPEEVDKYLAAQIDSNLVDGASKSLTKDGAGTLILTGTNTYTGTTIIDSGTLQLGNAGASGSINQSSSIDMQGYSTLAFDRTDNNLNITQNISSIGGTTVKDQDGYLIGKTGTITQLGTGTTTLSGDDSGFTGQVSAEHGTLNVTNNLGSASSSPVGVTVDNDARLTGTGSLGGTVHVNGTGTIGGYDARSFSTGNATTNTTTPSPDGSATSMKVDGDLYMASGTTLATSLTAGNDGNVTASRLNVTGAAHLTGVQLQLVKSDYVTKAAANLQVGQAMTILTAGKGLYASADTSNPLKAGADVSKAISPPAVDSSLFAKAEYSVADDGGATDLDITLERNQVAYGSVGKTSNEIHTGLALDTLEHNPNATSQGQQLIGALNHITDKGQFRQTLNNLSGEIHASVRTGLIQDSMLLSNAVMTRLDNANCEFGRSGQSVYDVKTGKKNASCEEGHTVLWGQAYGSIGHNSGDGNAAGMSHNTAGFIMGVDTAIHQTNWRVGGFAAYGHSMFNIGDGRSSSANSNNISVGGYAGTHWGRLNLRMGGSYSWNIIRTRRLIAAGNIGGRTTSGYLGGTAQGFAELGYKMHMGRTTFEPFANVTYVNMQTNRFREHGTAAALNGRGQDNGVTFSSFGFRAATRFNIGKAVFMPHLSGAYRHAFGNTGSKIHQSFAAGSQDMGINGVFLSNNAAVINTGITARLTNRIDLDVSYIGQYGNRSVDSGATGSFKFRF